MFGSATCASPTNDQNVAYALAIRLFEVARILSSCAIERAASRSSRSSDYIHKVIRLSMRSVDSPCLADWSTSRVMQRSSREFVSGELP
jgi:hypothetical protein